MSPARYYWRRFVRWAIPLRIRKPPQFVRAPNRSYAGHRTYLGAWLEIVRADWRRRSE